MIITRSQANREIERLHNIYAINLAKANELEITKGATYAHPYYLAAEEAYNKAQSLNVKKYLF